MGRGDGADKSDEPLDRRLLWLEQRYLPSLKMKPAEAKKFLDNEENRALLLEFLDVPDRRNVFIVGSPTGAFQVMSGEYDSHRKYEFRKKVFFFTKAKKEKMVDEKVMAAAIVFGDLSVDALTSLHQLSAAVITPLLGNKENVTTVPDVYYHEMLDQTHRMLAESLMTVGRSQHRTLLPIPPTVLPKDVVNSRIEKELVLELETVLTGWTTSIKAAMSSSPEELHAFLGRWPGPLDEIQFWKEKVDQLQHLEEQLCHPFITKAVFILKAAESSYFPAFSSLTYELHNALLEAAENYRFLKPLAEHFEVINVSSSNHVSFEKLSEQGTFKAIFHLLYLVWKHSTHYSTIPRMVLLITEIANDLIESAKETIDVPSMFNAENEEIVKSMTRVLIVVGEFKTTFFHYKARSVKELQRPWRFQNAALFRRLDAFLERCHDLLDLLESATLFTKIANIRIGGTDSARLTDEVDAIYASFFKEYSKFQNVPYDVLDIDSRAFETDYDRMRLHIQELEQRLALVMNAALSDSSGLQQLFKIVDSFEGFTERPVLHQEWSTHQLGVLKQWQEELLTIQDHFVAHKESPVLFPNMPATSSAVLWGQGLLARLNTNASRVQELSKALLHSDLGEETTRLHDFLRSQLRSFIHASYESWASNVGQVSADKLRCKLLVRDANTSAFSVNFDPHLVKTLKEVTYLESMASDSDDSFMLPPQVVALHKSRETLRAQVLRLDYVCQTVNSMRRNLLPSEKAILQRELAQLDVNLMRGVDDLQWYTSDIVDQFIADVVQEVSQLDDAVALIHRNVKSIRDAIREHAKEDTLLPLIPTKNDVRIMTEPEFKKKFTEHMTAREAKMQQIDNLVEERMMHSLDALNTLKRSLDIEVVRPDASIWLDYLEYVTGEVAAMLTKSVTSSLTNLKHQVSPQWLSEHGGIPLLDIKLVLSRPSRGASRGDEVVPSITFEPPLASETSSHSLELLFESVIERIIGVADFLRLIDPNSRSSSVTFLSMVTADSTITELSKEIQALVAANASRCEEFLATFRGHSRLYEENIAQCFHRFLRDAAEREAARPHDAAIDGPKVVPYFDGVPLVEYDIEIKRFQDLHDQLEDLPMSHVAGFVKIDSKPLRAAMLDLCSRWRNAYLNHLIEKITGDLKGLYSFISEAEQGLDSDVVDGDLDSLKKVMRCVRDCRRKNDYVSAMLDPISQAVLMLRTYPTVSVETIEEIEELRKPAQESWNTLFRKSLNTREQNSGAQDREAERMKDDTAAFEDLILATGSQLRGSELFNFTLEPPVSYDHIDAWSRRFLELENAAKDLWDLQELFELTPSEFRELRECRAELVMLKHVWDLVNHVTIMFKDWMTSPFTTIDVDGFLDEIKKLNKQLKGQPMKVRSWDVFKGLEETVANMSKSLPLCAELRSPAMRERHWQLLLKSAHQSGSIDPESDAFTLERLIALGIHKHAEEVYNIVEKAQKELQIERSMTKIVDAWDKMCFEYELNTKLDIYLLCSVDAVVEQLEADSNTLQSMLSNRFVDEFIERVQLWQKNLGTVDACMTKWNDIQRKWVNLYPIFVLSADIREQLPEDAKNFQVADDMFRQLMRIAHRYTNVVEVLCTSVIADGLQRSEELEGFLTTMEEILLGCEKSLSEYLETKRKIFPRFFFVSSADLVDILSKGSDPRAVMVHMSKIVDSVEQFTIDDNPFPDAGPKSVWEMVSIQGEHMRLAEQYACEGPVEHWLAGCITAMQKAVRYHIQDANSGYVDKPRTEWIYQYPCQAVIVASRSWFTTECQSAFHMLEEGSEMAMKDFLKMQKAQLDTLIKEVLQDRKSNDRKMLVHLITIDVHSRDIVQTLVDDKVDSVEAFAWQSQLRYYWDESRGSEIRICDAEFINGYEYIGLCGCLVITKLTDRCYTTLSQALRLKKGGAPAGPAGTGKTETTKDLARNLGIACYVFNCSDQMNYITLGQIFKGLAMSGSWGCFDEFNRISIEVLSVVATQVGSILNALKASKKRFRFMDEEVSIVHSVGMFITMNPGYAGRTELPENIKSLFRPCAMVVPDLKNICEIMLAAEGFGDAKDLALKFVTLYRLNKELLSAQDHYDWGLRAVKSVLYIAGSLKRGDPDVPERKVLMRALRDTNLAKLSKDDVYVFMGLITSLFPQLEAPKKDNPKLVDALKSACKEMGNFPGENDIFILKCLQYEEILHVRHSVFILGPAGCGKTQCWRCLQQGLRKLGNHCVAAPLNPKAITSNELYGFIHPQTKEWRDGVLSNIFRQFALESKTRKNSKWIVLDGIIDAEWIESMNTVMDDNKMLTLVSNERIPLTDSMRMIFEVSHLKNASPATVSRGGVVFINESDLGWGPFKDKWLASLSDEREATHLETLFDRYVPTVFEFWKRSCKPIVTVMDINIVQTICFLLEGLLPNIKERSADVYERYFVFALLWAFGGPLPSDGRVDYRTQFSNYWRKENPHIKVGEAGTVFDYYIDAQDHYEFKLWSTLVERYEHDPEVPLGNVSVQTADTVRMSYLTSLLVDSAKPVMLVGTAGTGKSNLILSKLRSLDSSQVIFRVIAFNARTSSANLQSVMEQSLEKRSGRQYGPINRKKLIFFLDDVNMPAPDKYGTQDAIALLQQQYSYGFWYDRVKIIQKEIVDLRYVGAMNPKSGTFSILDRLLRHFAVFSTNMPDRQDLVTIYGQILNTHFTKFSRDVRNFVEPLANATIELQLRVSREFLPTAILFHYQWNMRELFNIFQGLCNSTVKLHNDVGALARLWAHECIRTYQDRMPRESDILRFDDLLQQVQQQYFTELPVDELIPRGLWAPIRTTKDGDEGVYDECEPAFTSKFLESKLTDYNNSISRMELVLFNEAVEHVCRICRTTANPRGNALLVGVGGSGKQSLARLAAYINGLDIFQIQVTNIYGINEFRTDMQEIYKKCGLKGQPYAFIITDQQIVTEDMLVYLNDMLSSGNVPDLFVGDERDGIISSITNEVKLSGHPDYSNPDVCWEFFVNKVRANLHIILCFSPVGQHFAKWCRQFPALANTTIIDWFHPWPEEALRSVAHRFLSDVELGDAEMMQNIADFMAESQRQVTQLSEEYYAMEKRRCYTTPKSFLELIQLYKELLAKKRDDVRTTTERLVTGIDKIREAGEQVSALQEVLQQESIEVDEAREKTSRLMEHVGREKGIVEDQNAVASVEEAKTNKIVQEVEAFAAECARDLAAAKPLVDEAMAALNTLDKASLTELKSMSRPPDDVVMVCAAVKILTADPKRIPNSKQRDWSACKQMMANVTQWMKDLLAFDQDNIPQQCIDALQVYVTNPAFEPNSIVTKSFAAAGLCKWVIGMNEYHKVRCQVRPKEERLAEAQERLAQSKAQLKKVQDKVNDLKSKLDVLMKQYDDAVATSNQIEAKAQKTKTKMSLANRLVDGLADERVRWGSTIEQMKLREKLLIGDVLLAAAFVSYIGPFTRQFRDQIVHHTWIPGIKSRDIPMTPDLDLVMGILTSEATVASWNNEGLPNDTVSTQNGAIMTNCTRWPLMIDPQLQGIKWIRTREEKRGLVVVQPGQMNWLTKLIGCIEEGAPCLIEGCGDTLDPVLDNVLGRVTFKRGRKVFIRVGGEDVEYNPKFRLVLQTRLSNPHFKPEVNAQTTILNFMVTELGLEDQLLAVVVNQERPDLEEKRVTLLRHMNTMTIELQQCEDGLLFELSNATGDILENLALVENLENTKRKATEINKSMLQAQETQKTIASSRQTYQPVAARGSLLFFQLDQLCKIDHMYQYSLEAFMVVFNKALAKAPQPEDPSDTQKRVDNVSRCITESVFAYVARGLFERHKLIFSSLLTFAILSKANEIDRRQLDFLLQGRRKTGFQERPETVAEWCPEPNWCAVLALADVEGSTPSFALLPSDMAEHNRWRLWTESEKPEDEKLPTDWKNLTQFQRLLILRCLRPDRLTTALERFVSTTIGKFFVSDQAVDIAVSFKDAGTTTPLFFILSPGVDPVKNVEALGAKLGFTYDNEKLYNVSLGQGQEVVAERALERCFANGGWAMLNNVHLVERWLRKLEKMMDSYSEVYTKMAQLARAKQERRNARRMAWLTEQETLHGGKDAEEDEEDEEDAAKDFDNQDDEHDAHAADPSSADGDPHRFDSSAARTAGGGSRSRRRRAAPEPSFESDEDDEDASEGSPLQAKGSLDFRVFLSAEPSQSIPVGILQRCIKLTSEPPTGINQNIKRAMMNFQDEPWERSSKPTEFRAVTFAMCFFHAVVVERKKFGPQGWNRVYPFNVGDLTTCIDVLGNYIDDRPKIPWEDLRYVFGEIMYGGHITDDWDRVLCMAYLQQWIVAEVVDGIELAPGFAVPPPMSLAEYNAYVDENCPPESPLLYGLHPNAEMNFRSAQADVLFRIITELQPKQKDGDSVVTPADIVRSKLDDMLEKLPEEFNLIDISERLDEDRTPPQHVFYQECERMNLLLATMKRTLQELLLGLQGALSMSARMQQLFDELLLERLPESWMRVSFASMRALASWFDNLQARHMQLNDWTAELLMPKVTMLSYFFNPMSLLTAIMQHTAINNSYDLDQMTLVADVTKRVPEQIDVPARDAAHLYGMHIEGARWDAAGCIEDARMKELYPRMPVVTMRSVPRSKVDRRDQYECPMYKTQGRGPGFVVGIWLRTKQPARKWVVAGVALILDVVE